MPAYIYNSNKRRVAAFNKDPKKKKKKINGKTVANKLYILIEILREISRKSTPLFSLVYRDNKWLDKVFNFFYKK